MPTTFSSRQFNCDPGSIKRAAASGPVFITDRDKPSLVVLAAKDYERLTARGRSLRDVLLPENAAVGDIELDFDRPASLPRAAILD